MFGKGQKGRVIPLRGRVVLEIERYMLEPLPLLEPSSGAGRLLALSGEAHGAGGAAARGVSEAADERADGPPLVVPPRCRRRASSAHGMTSGLNMHRARHTFATDLRRVADLGAASQALGHSDLSTTASIYGHYDLSDLERAMEALRAVARADEEEPAD